MIVAFDLPVTTKKQRKQATLFRKFLLGNGFTMVQYSFYARPMVTYARMETHMRRVRAELPPEGSVRALYVTQAQWDRSFIAYGKPLEEAEPEKIPEQLQLW